MSSRAMARMDMLKSYLCFLEGKELIDFAALRPFDFTDAALGFASAEPERKSLVPEKPEITTATEDFDVVMAFSEDLDGDGIMLASQTPVDEDESSHWDLVTEFFESLKRRSNVL